MTRSFQDAIERLRELPEERQNELAEALMAVAESDLQPCRLTDEQVAEVRRRRIESSCRSLRQGNVYATSAYESDHRRLGNR
jgi:hypothetical protein